MTVTRRNIYSLTDAESDAFLEGLYDLKRSKKYAQYVETHAAALRYTSWSSEEGDGNTTGPEINVAHMGPAFLPWHRAFLIDFEADLQSAMADDDFGLPYWDWTIDGDKGAAAKIWSVVLMGGDGTPVTDGPFQNPQWPTVDQLGQQTNQNLSRKFGGANRNLSLPTLTDVQQLFYETVYDTAPWSSRSTGSFRNHLEGFLPPGLHNRVHMWVGGHMSRVPVAPNDPVFFLHHCNIDRIWWQWQHMCPTPGYLPSGGAAQGHNLYDKMYPWNSGSEIRTPANMNDTTTLGYRYDTFYTTGDLDIIVTTGNQTFAGTDDEVNIYLGNASNPNYYWAATLDTASTNDPNPFEQGATNTFQFKNILQPSGMPLPAVLLQEVKIGKAKGSKWGQGDWMLAGLKIVADGLTLYDNQSINVELNNSRSYFSDNLSRNPTRSTS